MTKKSPLRYPGGKARLFDRVSTLIKNNDLVGCEYAEPYAGGAGLALKLLAEGIVSHIHINDWDKSIWSFWNNTLNETENFINWIATVPLTVAEWHRQKSILLPKSDFSNFDKGCAAFYLNRVNRSGVIKGGLIGGIEQSGKYKMDCRFNRQNLIKRIKWISTQRDKITLSNEEALVFFKKMNANLPQRSLMYIDPPYFKQGANLYTNFYKPSDHKKISDAVKLLHLKWFMTYDHVQQIFELYEKCQRETFSLQYTLNAKKKATELLIAPEGIDLSSFTQQNLKLNDVA